MALAGRLVLVKPSDARRASNAFESEELGGRSEEWWCAASIHIAAQSFEINKHAS